MIAGAPYCSVVIFLDWDRDCTTRKRRKRKPARVEPRIVVFKNAFLLLSLVFITLVYGARNEGDKKLPRICQIALMLLRCYLCLTLLHLNFFTSFFMG